MPELPRLEGMQKTIEPPQEQDAERAMPKPPGPRTGSLHTERRRRPQPLRGRRWGTLLAGCGLALLPWLVVLATTLPTTYRASHWPAVWVGLDTMEAAGLITTGLLVVSGDRRLPPAAAATAALLTVDAWFDTMTAASAAERCEALVMALLAELPLAAVCAYLAVRALPRCSQPCGADPR